MTSSKFGGALGSAGTPGACLNLIASPETVKKASGFAEPARADATLGLEISRHPNGIGADLFEYRSDAKSRFRVEQLNT